MISRHLIINSNGSEKLILFIDLSNEMSTINKSYRKSVLDYIKENNIIFKGSLILIAVGSIIVASFNYKDNDISLDNINYTYTNSFNNLNNVPKVKIENKSNNSNTEIIKQKDKTNYTIKKNSESKKITNNTNNNTQSKNKTNNELQIRLYRLNGNEKVLPINEYLIGVISAEMPASFHSEALKAQAIVSRTYTLKNIESNNKITDSSSFQSYIDISEMKSKWGNNFEKYYNKIKDAVYSTDGLYITYNGKIIDAVYHSTSNGYTEDSIEVWGNSIPYLKSVDSKWDRSATSYERRVTISEEDLLNLFGIDRLDDFSIIKRDSTGRVSSVKVNNLLYSGIDIRTLLSLRSTDFDIEKDSSNYIFTTRGYGHGVGMSQYGANGMANDGYKYDQIIKHFYTNIKIDNYKK